MDRETAILIWQEVPGLANVVTGRALEEFATRIERREREACAAYCGRLAEMMEQGAGEGEPGGRLRQAEHTILAGQHYPFTEPYNLNWGSPSRQRRLLERAEMHKAPWKDYAGNDIYEGDRIQHTDGTAGTVVFFEFEPDPSDKWRVLYDVGDRDNEWAARISRLCLQIGYKWQAVVTPNVEHQGPPKAVPLDGPVGLVEENWE